MATRKKKKQTPFKKMLASIIIGFVAVAFVGSFAFMYAGKKGRTTYLAVVNHEPIAMSGDSLFVNFYRQFYEEERQKGGENAITEEKNIQIMRKALDTVIQRTLILQYAKKEGIEVSRDMVLASIVKKGYYASRNKNFDEERYNNTPESDRQRIFNREKEQLIINLFIEEFFNTVRVSDEELKAFFQLSDYGKKIEYILLRYDNVGEQKLKTFYKENPELFEKMHAAQIVIKDDRQKAEEVLRKVRESPDKFAEIAKSESQDPTAEKGGDLGWFYRNDMVPEFSEAAFKLKKDEISDIVVTTFGFHIIKALSDPTIDPFEKALFRVKQEYVAEHKDEVERDVALESKNILKEAIQKPSSFHEILSKYDLRPTTTDYITLSLPYIFNEDKSTILYELMNNETVIDNVFSVKVGNIGGPIKTADGEIIFRVLDDKSFDPEVFKERKDTYALYYRNLKSNNLFNDWYRNALNNSRIIDNFNKLLNKKS
jgi:parvulin-like peptidyl-prolyl isomerase